MYFDRNSVIISCLLNTLKDNGMTGLLAACGRHCFRIIFVRLQPAVVIVLTETLACVNYFLMVYVYMNSIGLMSFMYEYAIVRFIALIVYFQLIYLAT